MTTEADSKAVLKSMKIASETVREAIASAIPVASSQVLTVSVPGALINWKDFYYNADDSIKAPLAVQVKEARLVDGMIPLSKFTAGKTGKSVARSYLATLDLLVPVEASVTGVIGNESAEVTDERLRVIKDRYKAAETYLKSPDDSPGANGRSKVDTYVLKQSAWAKEVAAYVKAQGDALRDFQPGTGATTVQIKEAREKYMQWLQEHARDYVSTIQTRYMDWVVHGYKFMVDFNFGIVDISSGMKRIENSKEAFRNLTIIAEDGSSEYHGVVLTPSHWATIVRDKVRKWKARNSEPTPAELRAELRRLQNLLASHETLKDGIDDDAFFPVITQNSGADDKGLKAAYAEVYSDIDTKNQKTLKGDNVAPANKSKWIEKYKSTGTGGPQQPTSGTTAPADASRSDPFRRLLDAQSAWSDKSLSRDTTTVRDGIEGSKKAASSWLDTRIKQLKADIEDLKSRIGMPGSNPDKKEGKLLALPVVNEKGVVITDAEIAVNPEFVGKKAVAVGNDDDEKSANPWTRISCKASTKRDIKETSTSESASAIAAKAGWGPWSVSGGAAHTEKSAKAMSSMSNLEVEIAMDCMLVEIERPWLHAELFADADLDSGKFDISPGEERLRAMYENEEAPIGYYQQFSSYPTAFVVAADVELSFSGDTTQLESAVSASSTTANLSVGYGPFALSASHSQSKSKSKTKMESTATGCKISIQAPQIVGWVQTLLPQLPKPKNGKSKMVGIFN